MSSSDGGDASPTRVMPSSVSWRFSSSDLTNPATQRASIDLFRRSLDYFLQDINPPNPSPGIVL
ncbi:MAG: hypothetical protein ABI411_17150 [Tahibacter sp.]